MSSASSSATFAAGRSSLVALSGLELLHGELVASLLRSHDDGRFAREELYQKLELAGYEVGRRFAERLARDRPERLVEHIDIVKFLCRDFWSEAFRKPIDKLQTNNKGVYVLQDFSFRWVRYTSAPAGEDTKAHALRYLLFPCGLVRGCLAAFGLDASVNCDNSTTNVIFHLRLKTGGG